MAGVVLFGFLVTRFVSQHDDFLRWRQELDRLAIGFTWPAWQAEWPPLPESRGATAELSGPYAFAATHRDDLQHIACFCGCVRQGHHSNSDCYIRNVGPDGRPLWDDHSFTCSLCIDITRDVALMKGSGRSLLAIRREIDKHYGGLGRVGTATPRPLNDK